MQLAQIERESKRLKARLKELSSLKLKAIQRKKVKCVNCKKSTAIKKWDFVQKIYWVEPYSCTGGGYHRASETRVCTILCPMCEHRNYIYNHPSRDKIVSLVDDTHFSLHDIFNRLMKEDEE